MSSPKRTPLQAQWEQFRARYDKQYIMAFRLGDFYEFFHDDARDVSKILDITLTDRQGTPLAGFPYASGQEALERIVKAGRPVVVVDQVEDPSEAKGRIVDRDIVRVITPGTILEDNVLEKDANNFIAALALFPAKHQQDMVKVSMAFCDISTGDFFTTSFVDTPQRFTTLSGELTRFAPVEILVPDNEDDERVTAGMNKLLPGAVIRRRSAIDFDPLDGADTMSKHFKVSNLESFGIQGDPGATGAAGALLRYLQENQKQALSNITTSTHRVPTKHMLIDQNSVRNLEILKNTADGSSRGTLFELFSKTCTAMGMRLVKRLLLSPLMDCTEINARLDFVEMLVKDSMLREELKNALTGICDLERLIARINYSNAVSARHLVQLGRSLEQIPAVKGIIGRVDSDFARRHHAGIPDLGALAKSLLDTFVDAPPSTTSEGGMLRPGINQELDDLRGIRSGSDQWLERFQDEARQKYGLSTLRVKNNSVFGYFIEISKSYLDKVPSSWTRKQTISNAERYTTPELKAMEDKIVSAEGRIFEIEKEAFLVMKATAIGATGDIQGAARAIAEIDVMVTMAQVAASCNYVRPRIMESGSTTIKGGRHPVIENLIGIDKFISNDVSIDPAENVLTIVTGPNMSGKSTFLRQICLIVLMAQAGSFVPASEASVCITDKIFSRVGAQDDITKSKSTFLVEMNETAYILNHATPRSLVILDELGRGTSTFDGLSLAWAVAEYLQARAVKTLFATHYYQLSDLESFLPRTKNLNVVVKEDEKTRDLIFLHKVVPGASDKSYGIQVAKLAGIPAPVIARAEDILKKLSDDDPLTTDRIKLIGERGIASPGPREARHALKQKTVQTILFPILKDQNVDPTIRAVREELDQLDIDATTPLDALAVLKKLKDKIASGNKV